MLGVPYSTTVDISLQNTHPFQYPGMSLALAHNGDLAHISEMKPLLLAYLKPDIARYISGVTDSEWIYALLLSQLDNPAGTLTAAQLVNGVERTLAIIREVRAQLHITVFSFVNLFIASGDTLAAVRYCFYFGCYRTEEPSRVHEAYMNFLSLCSTSGREYGCHGGE